MNMNWALIIEIATFVISVGVMIFRLGKISQRFQGIEASKQDITDSLNRINTAMDARFSKITDEFYSKIDKRHKETMDYIAELKNQYAQHCKENLSEVNVMHDKLTEIRNNISSSAQTTESVKQSLADRLRLWEKTEDRIGDIIPELNELKSKLNRAEQDIQQCLDSIHELDRTVAVLRSKV